MNEKSLKIGIITNNRHKGMNKVEQIAKENEGNIKHLLKEGFLELKNGTTYKVLDTTQSSRGYRFQKVILDDEVTKRDMDLIGHIIKHPYCTEIEYF